MRQSKKKRGTPVLLFTEYVKVRARGKREQGKLSTAELYEVAGRHFERFLKGRTCRIKEVTATLIADFHCFLQRQRLRTNSINSYLSSLRAVYNAALSEGLVAAPGESFREAAAQKGGDRETGHIRRGHPQDGDTGLAETPGTGAGRGSVPFQFHGVRDAFRGYRKPEKGEYPRRRDRL
ncbi:phage integrase SAM-like domain-containing protein [Parabacteroides distasonis]|nr:phage integrase SAM-like domain-containing protein [Parabacteroides distasonis]